MDFTPHKLGYFTPRNVELIADFDPDQYDNRWYNVVFQGDAETYMWLAKNEPEEGKKYYGHIEPTKSGKRLRFKTDKPPEDAPRPTQSPSKPSTSAAENKYLKDVTDIPMRFMQSLLQYYDVQKLESNPTMYNNYIETVKLLTEEALGMIENIRSGQTDVPTHSAPVKEDNRLRPAAAKYQFKDTASEFSEEDIPEFDERP